MNNEVLVVLGVQNSMEEKYASMTKVIENIVEKFKDSLYYGAHIYIVKHKQWKGSDESYCLYGTPGFDVVKIMDDAMKLATYEQMDVITKPSYGSIDLIKAMKDIKMANAHVTIIGGPENDVVANAALIRSNFKGVNVSVDASCCYALNERNRTAMIEILKSLDCDVKGE